MTHRCSCISEEIKTKMNPREFEKWVAGRSSEEIAAKLTCWIEELDERTEDLFSYIAKESDLQECISALKHMALMRMSTMLQKEELLCPDLDKKIKFLHVSLLLGHELQKNLMEYLSRAAELACQKQH